jgi:hypothetical protein
MIKKIISGGQTGVERAALDVAIKLGIAHGGWIPRGRKAEDGPLPEKYLLKEMPKDSHFKPTEQNVIGSDGTLIFSHGELVGGSVWLLEIAYKHDRPCLHINLNDITPQYAVPLIRAWIIKYRIKVLNVTGSGVNQDQGTYRKVFKIIEVLFHTTRLGDWQDNPGDKQANDIHRKKPRIAPKTVDDAVDRLIDELPLKYKSLISKMSEDDLGDLHFSLGLHIRNRYLYPENRKLLESCRYMAKDKFLQRDQASTVIVERLWKKLMETHRLRVVK